MLNLLTDIVFKGSQVLMIRNSGKSQHQPPDFQSKNCTTWWLEVAYVNSCFELLVKTFLFCQFLPENCQPSRLPALQCYQHCIASRRVRLTREDIFSKIFSSVHQLQYIFVVPISSEKINHFSCPVKQLPKNFSFSTKGNCKLSLLL